MHWIFNTPTDEIKFGRHNTGTRISKRCGGLTFGDFLQKSHAEWAETPGIGKGCMENILEHLRSLNLKLAYKTEPELSTHTDFCNWNCRGTRKTGFLNKKDVRREHNRTEKARTRAVACFARRLRLGMTREEIENWEPPPWPFEE